EAGSDASREERASLNAEIERLKKQLDSAERQLGTEQAHLREPEINIPIRNIYPAGAHERSTGTSEINRIRVPRATNAFLLILGDYKPGHSVYRIEIRDRSGRITASREGLKPDQGGELSVMLNRTLLDRGECRIKLYAGKEHLAEYVVRVE